MDASADPHARRMQILEMIESGQITTEEGLALLNDIQDLADETESLSIPPANQPVAPTSEPLQQPEFASAAAEPSESAGDDQHTTQPVQPEVLDRQVPPDLRKWRNYWMVLLWIGVGITIFGSLFMSWALQASGFGFWFLCGTLPFAVGVLVIVLAVQSRTAHWLHLRVRQAPGERPQNIALSFPLPIGLTSWFIRTFRGRIPGLENLPPNVDQILQGIDESTSPDNPIIIQVDDDDQGEKVWIYIG